MPYSLSTGPGAAARPRTFGFHGSWADRAVLDEAVAAGQDEHDGGPSSDGRRAPADGQGARRLLDIA